MGNGKVRAKEICRRLLDFIVIMWIMEINLSLNHRKTSHLQNFRLHVHRLPQLLD